MTMHRYAALEQADSDISHGDLGSARRRLESLLNTLGYEPELMARIGQICFKMQDPYFAGQMWLLSGAEGDDVERAVDHFVCRAGPDPANVAHNLPAVVHRVCILTYPPPARVRIDRLHLEPAIARARRECASWRQPGSFAGKLMIGTFIALAILAIVCCMIGAVTVVSWLFR